MNKYKFIESKYKHLHTLNEKPLLGTTTVIKEVLPPMLSWYGSGMACKTLGWYDRKPQKANSLSDEDGMPVLEGVFGKIKEMTALEFLNFLDVAYCAHDEFKKEKGDWGKKTHREVEEAIKEAIASNGGFLKVEPYENEAVERFATWGRGKEFLFSEVNCYSEKLWLGGQIDFLYKENGQTLIGDLKTSKDIYSSAFIQIGMYDFQQAENGLFTSEGKKVSEPLEIAGYTTVNVPKEGGIKFKTFYDTEGLKMFSQNIVQLFNLLQNLKEFIKK